MCLGVLSISAALLLAFLLRFGFLWLLIVKCFNSDIMIWPIFFTVRPEGALHSFFYLRLFLFDDDLGSTYKLCFKLFEFRIFLLDFTL